MSKFELDMLMGKSKSNCLLDGLYKDTFPFIFCGFIVFGKCISQPNEVFSILILVT